MLPLARLTRCDVIQRATASVSYTNRQTDVTKKFFVRVNVTEEFPFLVTKLSPYFDK
jgi:hypothetical protein